MSTSTEHLGGSPETVSGLRIPARYRHDWALFADWCSATDQPPLPASPEALALFLHEHPAAPATQRRRVSAINTVHTRHGQPPPGRSETVRRRLDTTRAAGLDRLAPLLLHKAAELPTTGWPGGLFGRRDALLLTLAATGMPFARLARLRRGEVTVDAGTLVVTTTDGERFCLPPESGTPESPAAGVYRRWAEILAFLDAYPNTDLLAQHLTEPVEVEQRALTDRQARQPLLPPIDRWGHLPLVPQPMTAQSVASIVRDRLAGRVRARAPLPLRKQPECDDEPTVQIESEIDLDPHYYERGVAARRQARDSLDGLADVFDEIEDRADALLEELLTVLDGL
ncbi:hypothetical protein QM787_26390 [Rhodococcus ruber]|uniref:Recombinase n=1 Tax=Rhodococcus ruber TaxID=1830 RepID=A0A098BNF1_9NOCA|nr:hypothetical protein [Rhodococcus ruber]MCD2130034.1 hypothetical protein [Rhodococcus ruber]MCZ4506514.1 hypothetical protein [Rhodococcus ruber]MCZ4533727.1 hypothetical protein [Rhodococcus ruber]MCZ4623965.1 hypothetical protein [Rhodococcus ruber]MDI9985432.1 hypothetical protein [Rhodococcus ruber]